MTRTTRLLIYIGLMLSLTLPAMAEEASPPNAVDDHIETEQKTTHIYVLDNDSADGDPLDPAALSIVSDPSRGDAVVIAKGAVRVKYTVTATESFTDKFRYSICNTAGLCATATVTVNYHAAPTTTTTSTISTTSTTSTTTPAPTTTADAGPTTPSTIGPNEQVEGPSDQADDTAVPETSTTEPDPDNLLDLTDETPSRPNGMTNPPGTTIGEPNGFQFHADVLYLGQTGKDTLRMVATPALMVSGLVGFLMVGLPQNSFGTALGFLVALRRKRRPEQDTEASSGPGDVLRHSVEQRARFNLGDKRDVANEVRCSVVEPHMRQRTFDLETSYEATRASGPLSNPSRRLISEIRYFRELPSRRLRFCVFRQSERFPTAKCSNATGTKR